MKERNVAVGGYAKDFKEEYRYMGVWYKPWTWLKWKKFYIVNEFQLIEFSFVSNPINPHTKVNE